MGEQRRRAAAARAGKQERATTEPGVMPLTVSVEQARTAIVLWRHVMAAGDRAKAADLHLVLTHWVVRVAACDPGDLREAEIKLRFLTRDLPALQFTLPAPAQRLIDAAVDFEASRMKPAGSCQA